MSKQSADVVIVGGGVAGLSMAYHLSKRNLKVVLFDKEISFDIHSSGRNASIFRQVEADAGIASLAHQTRTELDALFDGSAYPWMQETGASYIADNAQSIEQLELIAKEVGVASTAIDSSDLQRQGFVEDIAYGIRIPTDGIMDTHFLLSGLYREIRKRGVELRYATEIKGLCAGAQEGFEVHLDTHGTINASQLVIASGAWAGYHGDLLSAPVTLNPLRRHLLVLDIQSQEQPTEVFWRVDAHACYFRPESKKVLFSPCDEMFSIPQAPPKDPESLLWAHDRLRETIPRYAEAEVVTYWSGLRTFSEDRQPVLGADPRVPGLHWCAGLGGHGMTIGLGAAEEVTKGLFSETSALLDRYGVQRLLDATSSTQEKVPRQSL